LGSPDVVAGRKTLPGMAARPVLDVITAASVLFSRLALTGSAWTTRTGRRLAGLPPWGSPISGAWRQGGPELLILASGSVSDRARPCG
jgi:hypothetical protein